MLSWIQSLLANGLGVILILLAGLAAIVAGVRLGRENAVLRWVIGIITFVLILVLIGPILAGLNTSACELNYRNC